MRTPRLFDRGYPDGFIYEPHFIDVTEETRLVDTISKGSPWELGVRILRVDTDISRDRCARQYRIRSTSLTGGSDSDPVSVIGFDHSHGPCDWLRSAKSRN
jgi:hypothetical protein